MTGQRVVKYSAATANHAGQGLDAGVSAQKGSEMAVVKRFTEQLVIMEEESVALRLRAIADRDQISVSQACRDALRAGLEVIEATTAVTAAKLGE